MVVRLRGRRGVRRVRVGRRRDPRGRRRPSAPSPRTRGTAAPSGCGWASTPGEVLVVAGDYVGHRGPPRGARRRGGARRPGHRHGRDARRSRASPGGGITLRDLGEHRLKDFARAGAAVPGRGRRPRDVVSRRCKTLDLTPNNLPPQLTTFVGRAEVDERRGAARPDAAADAHRARRDGQDAAVAGAGRRLRRALPGRRLVRAARAGHRPRARGVGDRGVDRPARARSGRRSSASRTTSASAPRCSCSTTSSRWSPAPRSSPTCCARRPG